MELFCIAFAADCSNSAMQAAAVYSYIKTYLTLTENCNECADDFIASTVAKIWNYSALHLQQTAVTLQCKWLQYIPTSKHT